MKIRDDLYTDKLADRDTQDESGYWFKMSLLAYFLASPDSPLFTVAYYRIFYALCRPNLPKKFIY